MKTIYVIGALKHPRIPMIANEIRSWGYDAFDDWWSPSEDADEWWQRHEFIRGRSYLEAINGWHARHVCDFDETHLDRSHGGVLVLPAGKSAHIELGYLRGQKKPTFVLFEQEPDRYDVMYRLGTRGVENAGIHFSLDTLKTSLQKHIPV